MSRTVSSVPITSRLRRSGTSADWVAPARRQRITSLAWGTYPLPASAWAWTTSGARPLRCSTSWAGR